MSLQVPKKNRLKRWIKLNYYRLVRMKDSPHKVAGGMALGMFLGVMPIAGPIYALIFATLLKLNRGAAVLGTILFNTATTIPIWIFSYSLGSFLMGHGWNSSDYIYRLMKARTIRGVWDILSATGISLLIGVIITSVLISLISYLITYRIMVAYQDHIKKKRLRHHEIYHQ